jgi:hypothetical protein
MILKAARMIIAAHNPAAAVKSRTRSAIVRKVAARAPLPRHGIFGLLLSRILR